MCVLSCTNDSLSLSLPVPITLTVIGRVSNGHRW